MNNMTRSIHNPQDAVSSWQTALEYLKDGNARYKAGKTGARISNAETREILKDGQKPFAVIVTCSDSRAAPEIYLDQGLGDIFVIRNAGNVADATALGSIEYAVEHLKTPLIAVIGHSSCGAVTGAFHGGEFPENLETIIKCIEKASEGCHDLASAVKRNIEASVDTVRNCKIVAESGTHVIGGYYDIVTGDIEWL